MFADVDADIYVIVDGDATYDAPSARRMIERLIDSQLDMVVGSRVDKDKVAYRAGHRVGIEFYLALSRGSSAHRSTTFAVRLSRILAPVRQIVSGPVRRLRN